MNWSRTLLVSGVSVVLAGCAQPRPRPPKERPPVRVVGIISGHPKYKDPVFIAAHHIRVGDEYLVVPRSPRTDVPDPDVIRTRHVVRIKSDDVDKKGNVHALKALLGPAIPGKQEARAKFKTTTTMVWLGSGWIYLYDSSLWVETAWTSTHATGTAVVVEIDPTVDPPVHRVYFLEGTSITVQGKDAAGNLGDPVPGVDVGEYVEIKEGGTLVQVARIADNPERASFIENVRQLNVE